MAELKGDVESYLRTYGSAEHASTAALSVNLPGRPSTLDVRAGTTRFGGSRPLGVNSLWQIGSNTKAFTSVLLLQLEAEHRLSSNDTVGRWLPQYPRWRHVTIRRLLNMTSGIPSYDDQPAFVADYVSNPYQYFSKDRLVSYVVDAPATSNYSYSNTGYTLTEMIIEKVTGQSYGHELYTRLIEPLGLHDTYYQPHLYPPRVTAREPAGYFHVDSVPQLFGRDVSRYTLSWTRGAGGILSTMHDLTVWERALYGGRLLPSKQQAELFSLVSTKTGQPIERTSVADPAGFGLGVQQVTNKQLGILWSYEGGTMAFRTLHVYLPASRVILAMSVNSYTGSDEDHIDQLGGAAYLTLLSHGLIKPQSTVVGTGRP